MLYYKCTTNGGNMRVQKFNATALQRILHQHRYPPNPFDYDETVIHDIADIRTEIIEAMRT